MNFDEHIDRNQYPTMKWSRAFLSEHFANEETIPMSVADMDIKAPPTVIEHLQARVAHGIYGIYGYESKPESYNVAIEAWYQNRYGWKIKKEQIEPCPSIGKKSVLIRISGLGFFPAIGGADSVYKVLTEYSAELKY